MADRIRVGIVGATVTQGGSGSGANAHVPALMALPQYALEAVCTSREDTAKASAAAFRARLAFHSFADMAASPEIDLIVVCVRVPGHRELVMAGLTAGKPALRVAARRESGRGPRDEGAVVIDYKSSDVTEQKAARRKWSWLKHGFGPLAPP